MSQALILTALLRAAAEPAGVPLYAGRSAPGLFAATVAGKQAAQECRDAGFLCVLRRVTRGRAVQEICGITERGRGRLLRRAIEGQLAAWHDAGKLGDCPLPDLFRRLRDEFPQLTIGQFHDQLRPLCQERRLYLHPWTGPLYEMPEPALALLVGHEIAYYASAAA